MICGRRKLLLLAPRRHVDGNVYCMGWVPLL